MNDNTHKESEINSAQLDQFRDLMISLMRCCQERNQYQCERFELPDAELRCLLQFEDEHYLTPKTIALRMNIAKSRVTRIVDGLRQKSLVKRSSDPEDSRISLLSLTPKGKQQLEEIVDFMAETHRSVLEQFSQEQRQTLINSLGSLKLSMEAIKERMI
ncbi:MarR family winged helix-turn-helix transcriptional regulator [Desulfovibrio ferrophilus]|nr:MarR family transcriptional regulator [Desulfovibrio ferrophilus]